MSDYRRPGVYCIINKETGGCYIGSSVNMQYRWNRHKKELLIGRHHSRKLQNAWNKYGSEQFSFSVLEFVEDSKNLRDREQHWLDESKPKYNISPTAASVLGVKRSLETRRKLSLALKGRTISDEQRQAVSSAQRGKRASEETKEKMRVAQSGRKHSPETKHKMAESRRNYWASLSLEERRTQTERGRMAGAETMKRNGHTDESRRRISASKTGKMTPIEVRQKISETLKARHNRLIQEHL